MHLLLFYFDFGRSEGATVYYAYPNHMILKLITTHHNQVSIQLSHKKDHQHALFCFWCVLLYLFLLVLFQSHVSCYHSSWNSRKIINCHLNKYPQLGSTHLLCVLLLSVLLFKCFRISCSPLLSSIPPDLLLLLFLIRKKTKRDE